MKKLLTIIFIFLISASCNVFGGSSGTLGVMKTYDSGSTWQAVNKIASSTSSLASATVTEMAFDPNNRENLYLATVESGLWQSQDSAGTWKPILSKISAYDFFVDPANTNNIYVAGTFGGNGRIVNTTDGGKTWQEQYIEASANNSVNTITANYNNSREIYAGLNSGVFIKSIDGGKTWGVAYDFKDQILKARYNKLNNALYVLLRTGGIAKSSDGGANWIFITNALTNQSISDLILVTQKKVDSFVKMALDEQATGVIYTTTSKGLYKTIDDGANWQLVRVPANPNALLPRAIASSQGGMLAYTSIGSTILKTIDGGTSWQTQELPSINWTNKILIDPALPQIVYAGLIAKQ
jgi:photosystem II stability/assembly factor-like uncharacterized protein